MFDHETKAFSWDCPTRIKNETVLSAMEYKQEIKPLCIYLSTYTHNTCHVLSETQFIFSHQTIGP